MNKNRKGKAVAIGLLLAGIVVIGMMFGDNRLLDKRFCCYWGQL